MTTLAESTSSHIWYRILSKEVTDRPKYLHKPPQMPPMSLCASLPVALHQNSKVTLGQVWFLWWCEKYHKLKQLRGLFHYTFYSPSLREGRVGTQDVGTEAETMATGCLPKVCTSSLLGSPSVTFLMQPGNGSTHTGVGSLPSTSN